MNFQGRSAEPRPAGSGSGERRVATGLVPDFAFSGEGVAISEVREGTAADDAGLIAGDVILSIDGAQVADLRSYSNKLKQFAPGDVIEVVFLRDGKERRTSLTLMQR
jgi:S1-C subfamily serine protease